MENGKSSLSVFCGSAKGARWNRIKWIKKGVVSFLHYAVPSHIRTEQNISKQILGGLLQNDLLGPQQRECHLCGNIERKMRGCSFILIYYGFSSSITFIYFLIYRLKFKRLFRAYKKIYFIRTYLRKSLCFVIYLPYPWISGV